VTPIRYTLWPSLYDLDSPYPVEEGWPDLVRRFSQHEVYPDKFAAPGFGPYVLTPPVTPCVRHTDGVVRVAEHRCDRCVSGVTMAVFDVDDNATLDGLTHTDALLGAAGTARLWYSSWSWPQKVSYRLVIPLSRPVAPAAWPGFRHAVLDRFVVQADPKKCTGLSHFYFGPSCRAAHVTDAVIEAADGSALDVDSFGAVAVAPARPKYVPDADDLAADIADELDDEDESAQVDVGAVRDVLVQKRASWARSAKVDTREKAALLGRLLDSEPLAEHGSRNQTTMRVAGITAHACPDAALVALRILFRPSVDAMVADGSRLTYDKVDRFLRTALVTARARRARDEQLKESMGKWAAEARVTALTKR
jgi:hypothetical protein